MDQTSAHMQTEAQKPQNQKNNQNGPKHLTLLYSFASTCILKELSIFTLGSRLSQSWFVVTVSAICQKRNDSVVGQLAGPRWTRYRRGPTAFPSRLARWRNLRPV